MASTFSVEDIRLLEKTISIRERLIDNYIEKEALPTKARDIDALTNLLESVDRSVFSKAKISIEENANKVNEETKEVLKDLLLNLHKNTSNEARNGSTETPVFTPQGMSINEGELIPKIDQQDISEFLSVQSSN